MPMARVNFKASRWLFMALVATQAGNLGGTYTGTATMLLQALLAPHVSSVRRVIIDVGAHKRTEFAEMVELDSGLLVVAFEPTPARVADHRKLETNPRVILLPAAVASGPHRAVTLHISEFSNGECNTIVPLDADRHQRTHELLVKHDVKEFFGHFANCIETTETVEVPTLDLATVLRALPADVEIPLLKVDAQGADSDVVASAGEEISRISRVKVELQDLGADAPFRMYASGGTNKQTFVEMMFAKGFVLESCSLPSPKLREQDCIFAKPELRLDVSGDCFVEAFGGSGQALGEQEELDRLLAGWCCGDATEPPKGFLLDGSFRAITSFPPKETCFDLEFTAERCCWSAYQKQLNALMHG